MNFGTVSGFVRRNGMSILKKTAVAAGLIVGMAFLSDSPEDEVVDAEYEPIPVDEAPTDAEVLETTLVETEQN